MTARVELPPAHGLGSGPWALARLVTRAGSRRRAFRSALWSGGLIALLSAPAIALLAGTSAADATDILALRVLAYASWLVGGLGCWAFLAPDTELTATGTLARERGYSGEDLGRWWTAGVAVRIAVAVFLVTLLPLGVSIALSTTATMLTSRLLLLPGVAGYAILLGSILALLARLARRLAPRFPRVTLAGLVLLPFLASFWFPETPSVPGVFGWLLDGLIALGGWLP